MPKSSWTGLKSTTIKDPMELTKRMKNLAGKTYGSLTAIRPVRLSKQGTVVWEFQCTCGKLTEWIGNNVVLEAKKACNVQVPSCGCVRNSRAVETHTTHGMAKHPLHSTWQAMKQRCTNPNHPEYIRYGAKGVTVCDEWLKSAETFINWALTAGWQKGMHLDKDIISDSTNQKRVYSPDTCKFISAKENVKYSSSRSNFEHNKRIRLTPVDISNIKRFYSTGQRNQYELANDYGVSQASIWRAIHRF